MSGTLTQFPTGATQYKINFEYLARAFVVVTLVNSSDNSQNKVLVAGNDYTFLNPTTIYVTANQAGYDIVQIHRETTTELIVDFRDGSVLTASDLTNAELQAVHIAEEGKDQTIERGRQYAEAAGKEYENAKAEREAIEDIVSTSGWDSKLRSDLAGADGYTLVPTVAPKNSVTRVPITTFPSYNNSAIEQAMYDSVQTLGYAYIPGLGAEYTKYTISNTISPAVDLTGARVIVDDMVWIDSNYDNYSFFKSLNFEGKCKFTFRNGLFGMTGGEVEALPNVGRLNESPVSISPISFDDTYVRILQSDLDTFSTGVKGASNDYACEFSVEAGKYTGLFTGINIGETITGHIGSAHGQAKAESTGVLLRGELGWILFDGFSNGSEWRYRVKKKGESMVNGASISVPESGMLKSYSPSNATVGISLTAADRFNFIVNGVSLTTTFTSLVGAIYEIGFVSSNQTTMMQRVTGLNLYASKRGVFGHAPLHILIRGDSTAEGFISTFDKYLPGLLDGSMGTRSLSITNKAIAGTFMRQQLDDLKAEGAGQAYMVIMVGGTNEGQADYSPDAFGAMVKEFADWCISNGRVPVWVEPWMWYSKTFVGGAGQDSSNYENAAQLREAGKRAMASYGDLGICVPTTHILPAPMPEYVTSGVAPLLRDDIHQDELGYKLYAEAIASAIVGWSSKVSSRPRAAWSEWSRNTASLTYPSIVTTNSINVSMDITGFSNGQVVLNLPRGCRPVVTTVAAITHTTDNISYAAGFALITPNGDVTVQGLTSTEGRITIVANW